ncbi:MAG: DNA recombination protein RmuC [Eubacteriales bacterium]|nr:DNA recombination protein RmuC [Christensenellaceae bacterium]MDY5719478.1 DNA recombination protein RmuC [Eubacteriales bacterium]
MTEALLIAVLIVGIANLALVILLISGRRDTAREIDRLKRDMLDEQRALRAEVSENTRRSINSVGETLLNEYQRDTLNQEQRFKTFALENAQRMEQIRRSVERQLADIREDNGKKLDEMRSIVDEKLQKTLEDKLSRSFALVSERLEQVYKGLGEMQTLASGVGDLSKVLSNVKTRGILGEIQLGAILGEMMAPEQYEVNAKVKQATNERVEFAIKLPADDGTVLLPIDSKFPADAYTNLTDAYEQGNADAVKAAQAVLKGRIKEFAADIAKKYINPPYTTEFAVMFLPTEGLYAEVLRLNLMEPIQREYRVSIAGPSTMAALLNSLQMGFKSVAIQKRSGEVWKVLGAVKTEFASFEKTLAKTRDRLRLADEELGRLIGARTHKINRSLERVTALPADDEVSQLVDKYAGADDEDEQ